MPRGGGVPVSGTLTGIGTSAVALATSQFCRSIGLQADPDNLNDVFIGDATNQNMQLSAGASLSIEVADPATLFARAPTGTQVVNFIMVK
ncbi:MAG: hypothetical protein QQN63_06260 [Nitrosopumilus sp.]